jgi:hypothetical protein
MVKSITVKFDGPVYLPSNPADAFEVKRADGTAIPVNVDLSQSTTTQTIAVLTFTGGDVVAGSLADGNYTVRILAGQVLSQDLLQLDGDNRPSSR